jgi:hypothetical protein
MPQTLLALLAMILASLIAFNQQRNAIATYDDMLDNEIEMAASGVLMHVMELVGGRSFDERATPEGILAAEYLPTSPSEFAATARFGTYDRGSQGCNLEDAYLTPACDDIDDLDGIRNAVVHARFSDGRSLEFSLDIEVDYVVDRLVQTVSSTPTRHKRVVVTVRNPYLPHGQIFLERVFSYDPIKAEMNYESVHGPIGI